MQKNEIKRYTGKTAEKKKKETKKHLKAVRIHVGKCLKESMKVKSREKRNKIHRWKLALFLVLCLSMTVINIQNVWAYDYQMPGAYQDGTVTITALEGAQSANGYSTPGGYRVDYTLTKEFIAFQEFDGCDFYIGNNLNPSGGCHFAYKPNGVIWEQGALNLGAIYDGRVVGSATPDETNTVRASFTVSDLSELPNYICYTYQPAGGAYIHISDTYGHDHHVWYYQSLKNITPTNLERIDSGAPSLQVGVSASGTTATVNGKTWGTSAVIQATASDNQSRPGGIRFYKNGSEVRNGTNASNGTTMTEQYTVNENGNYQVKAYDQLGNESAMSSITVDCIDRTAPVISSFNINTSNYCTSAVLTVAASDRESGLHGAAYSFNNGGWTNKNQITVTENGSYSVRVRDAVGNESSRTITVSNIDRTLPTIHSIAQNQEPYCIANELTVTASDSGSGLHATAYSFNNGAWTANNKYPVTTNGTYTVRVRDCVGNIAEQSTTVSNIDLDKPQLETSALDVGEPVIIEENVWTKEKCIHVDVRDNGSGMEKVEIKETKSEEILCFRPDQENQKEMHFDTDSLPAGEYEIIAYDNLGNTQKSNVEITNVDCNPPTIQSVEQETLNPQTIRITVTADDGDGSGLPKEAYSFDGGKTWQETNYIDVDENDTYEIVVRDNMGLTKEQQEVVDGIVKKPEIPDEDNGDGNHDGNGSGDGDNGDGNHDGDGSGDGNNGDSNHDGDGSGDGNNGDGNHDGDGSGGGDNGNNNHDRDGSGDNDNGDSNHDSDSSNDAGKTDTDGPGSSADDQNPGDVPNNQNTTNTTIEKQKTDDVNKSTNKKTNSSKKKQNSTDKSDMSDEKSYDNFHEEDVSKLQKPDNQDDATELFVEKMEETLKNREIDTSTLTDDRAKKVKEEKKVRRIAAAFLAFVLIAGLLALGFYCYLALLHDSCVLYAVGDHNERKRLARIPLKSIEDDWLVEVPDHKLGDLGTGHYLVVFRTSFVKENEGDYVVVVIDKNRVREKLCEEIEVRIL
ncbi:MAG: hypothetical protein IIX48_08255 [Lachnospiraceae bacterium]|nr:hypothetical protein [Lachnospiraceae bacterium]